MINDRSPFAIPAAQAVSIQAPCHWYISLAVRISFL